MIMSVCVGDAAVDKKGEVRAEEYDEDLKRMTEEYHEMNAAGECFIHIRKRNSSNEDLRALSGLAKGVKFHRVNLKGKLEESIIANSANLASVMEGATCQSVDDIVREVEKEVRGKEWEKDKRGFEQHMLEEDNVRGDWMRGEFEVKEICKRLQ